MTRAWVLLALGTEASLDAASTALARLERAFTDWHDTPHLVQVLALQALAAQARDEAARAQAVLERAVRLAAPGGLVRTFVDLGPPMARLIGQATAGGGATEQLSRLRLAFGSAAVGPRPTDSGPFAAFKSS